MLELYSRNDTELLKATKKKFNQFIILRKKLFEKEKKIERKVRINGKNVVMFY